VTFLADHDVIMHRDPSGRATSIIVLAQDDSTGRFLT
jgi:hypothetical protein